jgi:hypothetical protein
MNEMGKKSKAKKFRKNKSDDNKPDEVYTNGPLSIARFGKNLVFTNKMTDNEHKEVLERAKHLHKETFDDLKTKIADLQDAISTYDPLMIMYHASNVILPTLFKHKSEADFSPEETRFLPALEYLQYLISRTQPKDTYLELTEPLWDAVWELAVDTITLAQSWVFTRPTLNDPPDVIDDLRFYIDNKRISIRVDRYPLFLKEYWIDSLTPYNAWLTELYKLDAVQIATELQKIHDFEKTGFVNRFFEAKESTSKLMERMAEKGFAIMPGESEERIEECRAVLQSDDFKEEYDAVNEKMKMAFTPAMFEITDVSNLPDEFLRALSIIPGESVQTDLENKDDISPLSTSVLHSRPFLLIDNKYYFFFHTGFEDRISELIEKDILTKKPEAENSMMDKRGLQLEEVSLRLLSKILRPEQIHINLFYPNPDDVGNQTELDGLIIVDDVLFLIEGKAGKFSEAASRGAPSSLLKDLKELIIEGQRQSERAERYIKSASQVNFFDESGQKVVCTIEHEKVRRIFRVITTREPLGWAGATIARLSVLDKNILNSPPWHVSLDDLRAISDIFDARGGQFCHYLAQRLTAAENERISQFDEMDHVGLYLELNYYHKDLDGDEQIMFTHYGKKIDDYFAEKTAGEPVDKLQQYLPPNVTLLTDEIEQLKLKGRFELLNFLFSLDQQGRDFLEENLLDIKERVALGRTPSMRFPILPLKQGISLTFATDNDMKNEKARSGYLLQTSGCASWLIVRLDRTGKVFDIQKLLQGEIPIEQLQSAEADLTLKVAKEISIRKVGRNDPCPCASGKKYKQCHGRSQ